MQLSHQHRIAIPRSSGLLALCLLLIVSSSIKIVAQSDSVKSKQSIAIFAPLYLDSAFDASGNYRHGKNLPKYFNAGLEFYQGIQFAIDSLQKENVDLDIHIYDTRSKEKLESILQKDDVKAANLFLGHVSLNEAAMLARAAGSMEIPFVNVNLPNDAGVKANPDYIVLNPTLGTHINAIYKYLQKHHALSPILYFRKKGAADDRLRSYFTEAEKSTASVPLKIKYITIDDSISADQLKQYIDTTKQTVCIAGSLDMNFGVALSRQLATINKNYKITVIGMPTWDQVDFAKNAYRGIDIVYSSPIYISQDNKIVQQIQHLYKTKYFSKAGDMVFTAFETLHFFAHLLRKSPDINKSLNVQSNTIFGGVDIEPVTNKQTATTDYFENKKLFFIKKTDGVVKGVY